MVDTITLFHYHYLLATKAFSLPFYTLYHWTLVSVIILKLGPCQFFFQSLNSGLNHYFLSLVHPNFWSKNVRTNISCREENLTCQISKKVSDHKAPKCLIQGRVFLNWKAGQLFSKNWMAIRFLLLNEHLENHQIWPVHNWGPCLKVWIDWNPSFSWPKY